jgi:ATP-dependent DNA helicase RecQ
MQDQAAQLADMGIPAAVLSSTQSQDDQRKVMKAAMDGAYRLLYLSPERLARNDTIAWLRRVPLAFFAIDEAHCISEWGHEFRPEYRQLSALRQHFPDKPIAAFTASATKRVRHDILEQLQLRDPHKYIASFHRANLRYIAHQCDKKNHRKLLLAAMRAYAGESVIVYAPTIALVEETVDYLAERRVAAIPYHGQMENRLRRRNQERWMNDEVRVLVGTIAFGLGINKPAVRAVIHTSMPKSIEQYYQEAGRAGRDGRAAQCVLLFSYQDRYTQEFFISKIGQDNPQSDPRIVEQMKRHAQDKLDLMIRYAQSHYCRRQVILDYFGDDTTVEGCQCDVCAPNRTAMPAVIQTTEMRAEVATLIRQILSGVARCKGKFGIGTVADVLAGGKDSRLNRWGLDQLSVYGLLRARPAKQIIAMIHRLLEAGLVRQRDPEGVKFRPVVELTALGIDVMKGAAPPPALDDLIPRHFEAPISEKKNTDQEINIDADPIASTRYAKLRGVRLQLARERQLPAYCVCHDSTLKLIAMTNPGNGDALEKVKGMGPMKVKLYGQALLEAMKE